MNVFLVSTKIWKSISLIILVMAICISAIAQKVSGVSSIEKLYEAKKYAPATALLHADIDELMRAKNVDSLIRYILWTGKLEAKTSDQDKAILKVNEFVGKLKLMTTAPVNVAQIYIEAGEFFGLVSKNEMGYHANEQALTYAMAANDGLHALRLANIENNMATYAQRMGDISLSISHGRKALQWMTQLQKPDYEKYYLIYNSMGTGMYYMSKLDSGLYFFNKALDALAKTEPTPYNKYYRPAVLQNNVAGIYGVQGKTTAGIAAMKNTINYLKLFVASREPHPKKQNAVEFQLEATDNLAGIYKELGDYKPAHELLFYAYQQKQKLLPAGSDAVLKSEILLGQLYYAMLEYDKALHYLNSGLAKISVADGDYLFWQADASSTLALLYESKKDNINAAKYYEKADSLYEESLQGEYDNIYLEFLTNAATFYADEHQEQKAISKANKGYNYIVKNQGAQTLLASAGLLNLAEVSYRLRHYQQALSYADKSLLVMNNVSRNSHNLLDSVKAELKKPGVILVKAKARYELLPQKNVANLSVILNELEAAMQLLERRKWVIGDAENTGILLANHDDLLAFIKKITAELFSLTQNPAYMNKLVELHESGLYNRIRSRLDNYDSVQFRNVPAAVLAEEKRLKMAIGTAISAEGSHDQVMRNYLSAIDQWGKCQQVLKTRYPQYYDMRYATIFKPLGDVQKWITTDATVVRYFYIDKELYVWVADAQQKKLLRLEAQDIESNITALATNRNDINKTSELLFELYNRLWAPFSKDLQTKKVVIIPDGILYSLSFEILTESRIASFKELATKSLLAKYAISYQYSLFLLESHKNSKPYSNGFVAFVPGFSDQLKNGYMAALPNKDEADKQYLSLLPQPFTINLANKAQKMFGGEVYANEASTASVFKTHAGGHQIIHIGTHAESDNLHPEYSRLIFAKDNAQSKEENYLYLSDIYSCDLSSGLAVLTACESGKTGFKDGEGMISLAHAFNYAGSQSILTGLWKIDEQSSTIIMDAFYKNLATGVDKDEALRLAKLTYLTENNGRIIAPYYWAGLVIMGDTAPLTIIQQKSNAWIGWLIGGVVVLLMGYFIGKVYRMKKAKL